jgi:Domain of unknown function (DUF4262)
MSLKGKPQDEPLDQSYLDKIEKHGHAVMSVADRVDEPTGEPNFSYSTGAFESYGAPELIVFGLSSSIHHWMINEFYSRWKTGEAFQIGSAVEGFLDDYPVIFVEAGEGAARDYMNFTRWYYEGEHFPVWQLVWPGVNSRKFPWDHDCPQDVIDLQPDLSRHGFASFRRN